MILKEAETVAEVEKIIETDPVRKHIDAEWRLGNGARVFYFGDIDNVKAAICMHTSRIVPDSEEELLSEYSTGGANRGGTKAIFYTVWSNEKGLGRGIINTALAQLIMENKYDRYITMSPKTEMARKFHESNGAVCIRESLYCNNFEYRIRHGS